MCGESEQGRFYWKWRNCDCFLAGLDGSLLASVVGQFRGSLPENLPLWIWAFILPPPPPSDPHCSLLTSSTHSSHPSIQPSIHPSMRPLQHVCSTHSFLPPLSPLLLFTISLAWGKKGRTEGDRRSQRGGGLGSELENENIWARTHTPTHRRTCLGTQKQKHPLPFQFEIIRISTNNPRNQILLSVWYQPDANLQPHQSLAGRFAP